MSLMLYNLTDWVLKILFWPWVKIDHGNSVELAVGKSTFLFVFQVNAINCRAKRKTILFFTNRSQYMAQLLDFFLLFLCILLQHIKRTTKSAVKKCKVQMVLKIKFKLIVYYVFRANFFLTGNWIEEIFYF